MMQEKKGLKEDFAVIENAERRKAVKTIVGGVTAIAAYNLLPAKWGTPIIESIFLPAHAATSGIEVPVDPSIPVTPGHPDDPDYPLAPDHPDHPHNNPMAVIGSFTTLALSSPFASIAAETTFNRIATYTLTLVNLQNNSSDTKNYTAQTIPVTLSPNFTIEGNVGDTVELTVTNNLTSEQDTAQYVISFSYNVVVTSTTSVCGGVVDLNGNPATISFTVAITPNPGAGQTVTLEDIKDAAPIVTFNRDTDANGEITEPVIIQTADIGSTRGLRATYQGATDICTVRVNP